MQFCAAADLSKGGGELRVEGGAAGGGTGRSWALGVMEESDSEHLSSKSTAILPVTPVSVDRPLGSIRVSTKVPAYEFAHSSPPRRAKRVLGARL